MAHRARIAVLFALAFAASATLLAQPIYRTDTRLVTIQVSVVDRRAQPVIGLTADQFTVSEDGRRQPVQFFADGALPVDVGILLDTSNSMNSALPMIQEASLRLVRALGQDDRAALIGLGRVLQPLTSDKASLERAIRATVAHGVTPLYVAIYSALHSLNPDRARVPTIRRQALVVLSDGVDTGRAFSFRDLLTIAHGHDVPIYVIAPRAGSDAQNTDTEAELRRPLTAVDFDLRLLAHDTGGRAFFPKLLEDLAGIYEEIAQELSHQYTLGYYAAEEHGDQFRRLTVTVNAPGVDWHSRTGYLLNR